MKIKMLPNTLNSKNRLYFERDSKNRRITSKIGNVFRNSKWSDYSLKNTNNLNKSDFSSIIKTSIKSILFILIVLSFFPYFIDIIHIDFYKIFNFLFDIIDFSDLSIFNLFESGKFSFFLISQVFWNTIFEKLLLNSIDSSIFNNTFYKIKSYSLNKKISQTLENNDINTVNSFIIAPQLPFLKITSSNTFLLNNLITPTLQQSYKTNLTFIRPSFKDINNVNITRKDTTATSITNINKWFLRNLNFSNKLSSSFYIHHLNYQFLNTLVLDTNLQLTSSNTINQNNIAKTLRWSYRYSNLHRKVILNSHKLTSVKKLLGSGFFDSTSTKNNIWFSDNFSRIDDFANLSKTLNTHWMVMYKSNLVTKHVQNYLNLGCLPSVNVNFNFLSFYESSFQFFLKRLYIYSSMNSNSFLSKPFIESNEGKGLYNFNSINNFTLYLNYFMKKCSITDDLFNPFYKINKTNQHKPLKNSNTMDKDVSINIIDSDFLLNDNLELLINLNNSLLLKGSTIKFFDINKNKVFKVSDDNLKEKRRF